MGKNVKCRAKTVVIVGGETYNPGKVFDLSADQVDWMVENGAVDVVPSSAKDEVVEDVQPEMGSPDPEPIDPEAHRAALVAQAEALGIPINPRMKNETIEKKIAEAAEAPADDSEIEDLV